MAVYAVTYDSKSSYITNGKRYRVERDDGRGLFNIRSNRGTMLTCLWEGGAHLGTRGNWTRIEEEEQVTLLPGDYVSTEGMTEDQYHAVARAFMAAGADGAVVCDGNCRRAVLGNIKYIEWDCRDNRIFHTNHSHDRCGRHLAPAQVIGAVNAGNQQEGNDMEHKAGDRFVATADSRFFSEGSTVRFTGGFGCFGNPKMALVSGDCLFNNGPGGTPGAIETFDRFRKIKKEETMDNDFKLKCILHSAQTYLDEEREELERSDFHKVKAMQKRDRHDELMKRARDMLPDGWRLVKSEDMVETLSVDANPFIKGMTEDLTDPENWREGDVIEWIEESSNFFTAGKRYTILAPKNPEEDDFDVIDDDNDRHAWDFAPAGKSFRFHSRPTT